MLFGQYNDIWKEAFEWIRKYASNLPDGEHEIRGLAMYANIHTTITIPGSEGVFEMHKNYADIHYCLAGGEAIKHSPIGKAEEKTVYDGEKDYQLFAPTKQSSIAIMRPNSFAIFFPDELHMPKIQDGENLSVRKVVIKIQTSLL